MAILTKTVATRTLNRWLPLGRAICLRQGVPAQEVEDVLQDAAVGLLAYVGRDLDCQPQTLLATIARNICVDWMRERDRERTMAVLPEIEDNRGVDADSVASQAVHEALSDIRVPFLRELTYWHPGAESQAVRLVLDERSYEAAARALLRKEGVNEPDKRTLPRAEKRLRTYASRFKHKARQDPLEDKCMLAFLISARAASQEPEELAHTHLWGRPWADERDSFRQAVTRFANDRSEANYAAMSRVAEGTRESILATILYAGTYGASLASLSLADCDRLIRLMRDCAGLSEANDLLHLHALAQMGVFVYYDRRAQIVGGNQDETMTKCTEHHSRALDLFADCGNVFMVCEVAICALRLKRCYNVPGYFNVQTDLLHAFWQFCGYPGDLKHYSTMIREVLADD